MSEDVEGLDTRAEASVGVDPAAVALALAGASRERADAFLKKQEALIDDQRRLVTEQHHHLREQFKSLRLTIWEKRTGVLLRVGAAFIGLCVAGFLGDALWNAAHSDGLIIESFSVPPDVAAKGVTGQVVASQMLDQLTAMQNATTSVRPAKSYANNWGDDIKVEIPDTGLSIGEAYRFLRGWLGHETRISGEVARTATGIAITARTSGAPGATFIGTEDNFGELVQKAAEHVYRVTQPYRYAIYLQNYAPDLGRPRSVSDGIALLKQLTESPDSMERAWAWNGLATASKVRFADLQASRLESQNGLAAVPDLSVGFSNLADTEIFLGHPEAALSLWQALLKKFAAGTVVDLSADVLLRTRIVAIQGNALILGDYAEAERIGRELTNEATGEGSLRFREVMLNNIPIALARRHDGAARTAFRRLPPSPLPIDRGPRAAAGLEMEAGLGNWQAVIATQPYVEETYYRFSSGWDIKTIFTREVRPLMALAKAKLGDTAGAEAVITTTPGDCYDCVRIRAIIASEEKKFRRADYWFAKAVNDAPSIPFAYEDWGMSLLKRGKPDDAIEKFALANQKGPHFADPLEGWGEALMAKNQSHLALAKFEESNKYAPNWGRLHLKWGEALFYAGRKDEARSEYQKASTLDLTAAEKSELSTMNREAGP